MDKALFWRAALIQAAAVAVLAGILIALPLGDDFFKDNGIFVGPIAWILCAVVTALILKLPWSLAVFAAAAGGVAGVIADIAGAKHWMGVIIAIAVFGACCGGYEAAQREMAAEGDGGAPGLDN
jgi:type II secretory pathway component PulF